MAKNTGRTNTRLAPVQRKAEILDAARELLRETGYENFLPTDVAKRCKVSEGTIYRYFATKKDLLTCVAEAWLESLLRENAQRDAAPDIYSRLRAEIDYALRVVLREPELTRYIFLNQRADPEYRSTRLYRLVGQFTVQIIRIVNDAVSAGIFRADVPVDVVRDMVFGAVEHQTWTYLRHEGEFSVLAAAEHITGVVFRGLAVAAPVNVERIKQSEQAVAQASSELTAAITRLLDEVRQ